MLNFLLEKNKKVVIAEYFLRVFTYFLLFLFFALIVLISLFLPSNFYSKYKNDIVSQQLSSIKSKVGENSDDPIKIIKDVNSFTTIFTNEKDQITFGGLIQKITDLKNKNIKISLLSFIKNKNGSIGITINGIAGNRDSLTLFDKELKEEGSFQDVELPVSNLIKNIDSDFVITLIYKK
ncbi:MAG: hypothetical protein PHN69_03350 [Candidatus Pacebacteria bacterium]|nr:hypothetical protein [Candidatus Paceibacterota bacterium]